MADGMKKPYVSSLSEIRVYDMAGIKTSQDFMDYLVRHNERFLDPGIAQSGDVGARVSTY